MSVRWLFGIFNLYEILYLKAFLSYYKLKIAADLDPNVGIF